MADTRSPEDAFDKVAAEVRVEIIRAFAQYRREEFADGTFPDRAALPVTASFTELFERVDVRDSGKFNYHLQELLGSFVTKADDGGYRLTMAGRTVAGSVLAGAYEGRAIEPTPIEAACPRCGGDLLASYEDGRFTVECADAHRMLSTVLPSGAVQDRSVTDLLALATRRQRHLFSLLRESACPFCYGAVSTTAGRTDLVRGDEHGVEAVCTGCGQLFAGDFEMYLSGFAPLMSFYADHGLAPHDSYVWELRAAQTGRTTRITQRTPKRISVRIDLDDERFVVTLDESATVTGTTRRPLTD